MSSIKSISHLQLVEQLAYLRSQEDMELEAILLFLLFYIMIELDE